MKKVLCPDTDLHGDNGQIVPIDDTAMLSAKSPGTHLKVYPGLPYGMCQTYMDPTDADLLEFIQQAQQSSTKAS